MEWVKKKYTYKTALYFVLLLTTLVLIFFSIYERRTILFLIAFVLLGIVFSGLFYYNFACYLLLRSKKQEILLETTVDRKKYFEKKNKKRENNILLFDKILKNALYVFPFVIALSVLMGVLVLDSVFLTLFLPAIILSAMLIFFFFKEIYENVKVEESDILEKEAVYINKNVFCYNGICYIYRGFGFNFKENKHRFLNIKFSTVDITEEKIKQKTLELINEVRD